MVWWGALTLNSHQIKRKQLPEMFTFHTHASFCFYLHNGGRKVSKATRKEAGLMCGLRFVVSSSTIMCSDCYCKEISQHTGFIRKLSAVSWRVISLVESYAGSHNTIRNSVTLTYFTFTLKPSGSGDTSISNWCRSVSRLITSYCHLLNTVLEWKTLTVLWRGWWEKTDI